MLRFKDPLIQQIAARILTPDELLLLMLKGPSGALFPGNEEMLKSLEDQRADMTHALDRLNALLQLAYIAKRMAGKLEGLIEEVPKA